MNFLLSRPARCTALALVCLLGAAGSSARAQTLVGLSFFDNELFSINTTTGAGTLLGNLGANVSGYGLAYRGSQLYTFNSTVDRIQQINPANGAILSSTDIGVGNLTGEGDLTFRSDGIGFLSTAFRGTSSAVANSLFSFNLTTGTSTLLASTAVTIDGLAFIGNTLYAVDQDALPSLYIVNQTTGFLTKVGALGVDMNSPFLGLTARDATSLFAAIDDRLYVVNAATGAATAVNSSPFVDLNFSSVSGLARAPAPVMTVVPEPSTYGLIGAAGLFLCVVVRKLRAKRMPEAC